MLRVATSGELYGRAAQCTVIVLEKENVMKVKFAVSSLAVLLFPILSWAQNPAGATQAFGGNGHSFGVEGKFRYYLDETYLNPSVFTVPAFRAGIRMANPPGKGASEYPPEWRQGSEALGRNYGDAFTQRVTFQTARFATGVITHEDPRYIPSSSRNPLARSLHALTFTLVDRSDSGHAMPAISNFVGATAAGFVGNAYLPSGFNNTTHAGQRTTLQFGFTAAGNLFREFAPQLPKPVRTVVQLIAR